MKRPTGLRATAKALGMAPSTFCEAIQRGRVTRSKDGTYDVEKCRQELAANTNLKQQSNALSHRRSPVTAHGNQSPVTTFTEQQAEAFRTLLERLRLGAHVIPERAIKAGLADIDLAACLTEMFMDFAYEFAGDDILEAAYGEFAPRAPEPDFVKLAKRHKLPAPDPKRTERFFEQFDA